MKNYLPRITDKLLDERLKAKGAILIEGPKWCGKTTSAKEFAKSFIAMDEPDKTKQYKQMAELNPSALLKEKRLGLLMSGSLRQTCGTLLDMKSIKGTTSVSLY